MTETKKLLQGTTTNEGLGIAFNQGEKNKGSIVLKTPENGIISLSDSGGDFGLQNATVKLKKGICLKFDNNTMITLDSKGITLEGGEITIKGSKKVMVNQSEFKK